MNGKSVEQEMINIAKDLQNDIIDDLSTLEPKQTTAKKAYNILPRSLIRPLNWFL